MEIFMTNITYSTTKRQIYKEIERILHSSSYVHYWPLPLNFHIYMFADKKGGSNHSGRGALTLPSAEVGARFLQEYGGSNPSKVVRCGNRVVKFQLSNRKPRNDVVETIRRLPYINPEAVEERDRRAAELSSTSASISTVQFGWECRDSVFSIEWQRSCIPPCRVVFDDERREVRIKIQRPYEDTLIIAILYSQIIWFSGNVSYSNEPVIFFSLAQPPTFELESMLATANPSLKSDTRRHRLSHLDITHEPVVPFTSLAIRLICSSEADLSTFRRLTKVAKLQNILDQDYVVERRGIFSSDNMDELEAWLRRLDWCVAFQVESLVRSLSVDVKEVLGLRLEIEQLIEGKGATCAAAMLRHFASRAKALYWNLNESEELRQTIVECFTLSKSDYEVQSRSPTLKGLGDTFDCLHCSMTPTTHFLEGPFPERSNRVIRSYPDNHDCFLRVSFVDESRLQYRFDREIDGPRFVKSRVGPALLRGIWVAGRKFEFLAYSQSALKEHAVWFVKPFYDKTRRQQISAASIIKSLGTFDDPKLRFCPARYGARISQAFTATEASVTLEVEEIMPLEDIENDKYCFTDGVGTMSRELAREIWKTLRANRRKARKMKTYPPAYQVRIMGSKGMLSIDYRLSGRALCLRPSMIKFEAPQSGEIEIAKSFDKPGRYFLNRPLIMILEALGVPYEVFQELQDNTVKDIQESRKSLAQLARLLEAHGLGVSFRLTSVMLGLEKLGIDLPEDDSFEQIVEFAVHHILRELKDRARIPVPDAFTLVGVADVHGYLAEDEIFACVQDFNYSGTQYLEGRVLISRSPTIHPGDVRVVRAIGKPPAGSCFAKESLPNTVVFSVRGDRPLPSCLGGGDLDGDTYNLIPLEVLPMMTPQKHHEAAAYDPAPRKLLDRPSTMADVAEFIMEYINSDVLGIIAINWLIIADQSEQGILDPDCLTLARLHSDAVDYPKSGQPVALSTIPKLKFRAKPDWNAPETVNVDTANYYPSQRAIGRLFRSIELPALGSAKNLSKRQYRQQLADNQNLTLEEVLAALHLEEAEEVDVRIAVRERVSDFMDTSAGSMPSDAVEYGTQVFHRYCSELQTICASHSLGHVRSSMLTEEEAMIGSIVAKSSQPRKRKNLMSRLREQTDILVRRVRDELEGEDGTAAWLERSWIAWELTWVPKVMSNFGVTSYRWVALGAIFEVIKEIEEEENPRHYL